MSNYTQKNKPTGSNSATPLEFHRTYHHDELLKIINDELSAEEFAIKHALTCWAWSRNGFIPADEAVIKKFLIRMFGFSNNTKSYKRVLEMFWVLEKDGFTTSLIKEAILKTGVYSASTTPSTTPSTCSELPQKHPSSTQVGFSNPLISLDQNETSKLVSKELTKLGTNLLNTTSKTQGQGQSPAPTNKLLTKEEEEMKRIVALDLQTGKATYVDDNQVEKKSSTIKQRLQKIDDDRIAEDQKLAAFIAREEARVTQEELAIAEAKEKEIAAKLKMEQEAKLKEAQAIKEKEIQAMMALEMRFSNWLDGQGASDQNRERMFSDCSLYAKRAKGGIKEVYEWFLGGKPYPKNEWLQNEFMERFKRSESSIGWTSQVQ